MLERLSRHPSGVAPPAQDHSAHAIRMVQMALETDTVGDAVWSALEEVVREGQATDVVKMVEDPNVAEDIQEHFGRTWPRRRTCASCSATSRVTPRWWSCCWSGWGWRRRSRRLESLEVADNRAMRRRLLTRRRLGPLIGPMLIERLPPAPWYVQRNLLALLGSLPEIPAGFTPSPYTGNDDSRVWREALKLMLRIPGQRDEAIIISLVTTTSPTCGPGLGAALEGCPTGAVGRLMALVNDRKVPVEIRALAIRVLGTIRTRRPRDWLVSHALTKPGWFRRSRLLPRSPELIAVIGALARGFRQDAQAQQVLKLAGESTDPSIRRAASGVVVEEAPSE